MVNNYNGTALFQFNANNQGWNNLKDVDFKELDSYQIKIRKPSYFNLDYRDEFAKTVENLSSDVKYNILYSGGLDSAITLQMFNEGNKNISVYVGIFKYDGIILNQQELNWVNIDCNRLSVTPLFVEIDVKKFFNEEIVAYHDIFPTHNIERYMQMKLLNTIPKDGIIVNSAGDPTFKPSNKHRWVWVDRSYALHTIFLSEKKEFDMIWWALGMTPELGISLCKNKKMIEFLETPIGDFDKYGKNFVYNYFFPEVPARMKSVAESDVKNGMYGKNISLIFKKLQNDIFTWKGVEGRTAKIPIDDIFNDRYGVIYG